ncbi:hypothetical protein U1Q18_024175 [Sarracenia purpurea var. burkii]
MVLLTAPIFPDEFVSADFRTRTEPPALSSLAGSTQRVLQCFCKEGEVLRRALSISVLGFPFVVLVFFDRRWFSPELPSRRSFQEAVELWCRRNPVKVTALVLVIGRRFSAS